MRRFGTSEVAGVIRLLLSDEAARVTGPMIRVDGGLTARPIPGLGLDPQPQSAPGGMTLVPRPSSSTSRIVSAPLRRMSASDSGE